MGGMNFRFVILFSFASLAAAHAAPFGPATANLSSSDVPTVTFNNGAGDDTITLNGGAAQLTGTSGQFGNGTFSGSGAGTVAFSETPNTVTSDSIKGLFSFSDNSGGSYVFDLLSVDTTMFARNPGVSASIGLYLLGSISDSNLQLDPAPASLFLSLNSTGNSSFAEAGNLAAPPAPVPAVPEPASLALFGMGLISKRMLRRRG